jgi:hypothetical protein
MTARTLGEVARTPGSNFAYFGDRGDWPVAYAMHRDSDTLERANYAALLKQLEKECDSDDYAEETSSHWLVGYVSHILVRPDTLAAQIAEEAQNALSDYPVLDDEELSRIEEEEALLTAECAYNDYGYGRMNATDSDVAPFILSVAEDGHGRGGPSYCGIDQWFPTREVVFRGVLAYRRYMRK